MVGLWILLLGWLAATLRLLFLRNWTGVALCAWLGAGLHDLVVGFFFAFGVPFFARRPPEWAPWVYLGAWLLFFVSLFWIANGGRVVLRGVQVLAGAGCLAWLYHLRGFQGLGALGDVEGQVLLWYACVVSGHVLTVMAIFQMSRRDGRTPARQAGYEQTFE